MRVGAASDLEDAALHALDEPAYPPMLSPPGPVLDDAQRAVHELVTEAFFALWEVADEVGVSYWQRPT